VGNQGEKEENKEETLGLVTEEVREAKQGGKEENKE